MLVPTHTHRDACSAVVHKLLRLLQGGHVWLNSMLIGCHQKGVIFPAIFASRQTLFHPVKPVKTCLSGVSNIFIIVSSSILFYFQSGFWWFTVRRGRSINVLFKLWYSSIGQQNLWPLKTYNHRGTCSGENTKEKKEMMDRGVCMRSVKYSFLSLCVFYFQESVPHRRQGDLLWEEVCVSAVLILSEQRQARQGPRAEL